MYAVQCCQIEPRRTFLIPLSLLSFTERLVHITEISYLLEIGHTTPSFSVYPYGKVVRSFDVVHRFRLMPTLSSFPPERAHTVVVVVVVIVDVASRRNAKENTTHSLSKSLPLALPPSDGHILHVLDHL